MPSAVIFDMDGLLIDSEPLWRESEIEIFAGVGLTLSHELCLKTTGIRIDEVVDYWYQRQPWEGPSTAEVVGRIVERVIGMIHEHGEPKEGVEGALRAAEATGARLALASSSPYALIDAVIDKLGLSGAFEVIYSAEEEELGKPHPGVYLSTARQLGTSPLACVAIEDSLNGVIAAKAARMKCIAVPEGPGRGDRRFALADITLASLAELSPGVWEALQG
jgi:mannitol-1-/sugar-/sorbitol-6-/2-deoxyglucose-6-phosphatase